jgi:hypothetical protein
MEHVGGPELQSGCAVSSGDSGSGARDANGDASPHPDERGAR